jgi:hypothetical protein
MLKFARRSATFLLAVLLLPSAAHAQAAITGVVKDTSGAVLPGVTVEAASPSLIEKVRSVTTDATGQYRVVELRPGTYSVTFMLNGFSTVKREGIELTGTFVATVNAELKVGALQETITVSGDAPVVDVQSSKTEQIMRSELVAAIPTSRLAQGVVRLVPGVIVQTDVGGASGAGIGPQGAGAGLIHGGKADDSRLMQDGMTQGWNGGGSGMFMANSGGAQEIVVTTSGGLGEAEVGGVILNVIPRDGGNIFSGSVFGSFANSAMQTSNFSPSLMNQGLLSGSAIDKLYDINPVGGGPIKKDRLWFFTTFRAVRADKNVAGDWVNLNANNPASHTYAPDMSQPAVEDKLAASGAIRLTWQATPHDKFVVHWDAQYRCEGCEPNGVGNTGPCTCAYLFSPEAGPYLHNTPANLHQVTWSSSRGNKVLLEAGYNEWLLTWRFGAPHPGANSSIISMVEQAGIIPGLTYGAPANYSENFTNTRTWRASMSYVTGAHSAKFGYFGGYQSPEDNMYELPCPTCIDGAHFITQMRLNNGVPNQISVTAAPTWTNDRRIIPTSFYAQDQWTIRRLTLQGGVRYDHMITSYPDFQLGPNPITPVAISYPAGSTPGADFNDITPRIGVAYDLFGTGKTALKFHLGKYPIAEGGGNLNNPSPYIRLVPTTTRSWIDNGAGGGIANDFVPQCNLANPAANGECGPDANQSFGSPVFSQNYDPRTISGWGNRPYQWDMGLSVQQEILPRVSVNVGYYRRSYGNFTVNDNLANSRSDWSSYSIVAPLDSRLPGGGGYTIGGLYDINPAKFGLTNNVLVPSSNFGNQVEYWHGVDVNINARTRSGINVTGGTSTGRRVTDNCQVLPNNPSPLYCHIALPFLTQVRGGASYTIPRLDVLVSTALNSDVQGANATTDGAATGEAANWFVPNALIKQSLGRNLAGNAAGATVNIIPPGSLYGGRITYLDIRAAKILKFGKTKTQIGVDVYNLLNSSAPQTYNQTFVAGGSWLIPQDVIPARFAKVSVQFDF